MKLKADDLLFRACIYAEQDREAFLDAYSHMREDPAAVDARDFLKQLRAYRKKRWGKTELEHKIDNAEERKVIGDAK